MASRLPKRVQLTVNMQSDRLKTARRWVLMFFPLWVGGRYHFSQLPRSLDGLLASRGHNRIRNPSGKTLFTQFTSTVAISDAGASANQSAADRPRLDSFACPRDHHGKN